MNILKKIRRQRALKKFRNGLENGTIVFVKTKKDTFFAGTFNFYVDKKTCVVHVSGIGYVSKELTEIYPIKLD